LLEGENKDYKRFFSEVFVLAELGNKNLKNIINSNTNINPSFDDIIQKGIAI